MTKEEVNKWMHVGLELQFEYKNKGYYLGPSFDENGKQTGIVFCEDYQDEILEAPNVDALWNSIYKGLYVSEILDSVSENEIDGLV